MDLTESRSAYEAAQAEFEVAKTAFKDALTLVVVTGLPDGSGPTGVTLPPVLALMLAAPDSESLTYLWETNNFQLDGQGSDYGRSRAGQIQIVYNPGDPATGNAGQTPDVTSIVLTVTDTLTGVVGTKTLTVTAADGQFVSVS